MKRFREYVPEQQLLMPPSLQEWLPEGPLVYFVSDVVEEMELTEIYKDYEADSGGQPAYDPSMMVKLLLYAYCVGVPSSRKIEKKTYEDIGFKVFEANQRPDHDTIA